MLDAKWTEDTLGAIAAPDNPTNAETLAQWAHYEGSKAAWNFLDTTHGAPGSTPYNTIHMANHGILHVWNFPSEEVGAAMTAKTLVNGFYWPLVNDLRASKPLNQWRSEAERGPLRTWGTGNLAKALA